MPRIQPRRTAFKGFTLIENLSFPSFETFPVAMGVTTREFPLFLSGTADLLDDHNATAFQKILPSRRWVFSEQVHGSGIAFLSGEALEKGPSFQRVPETDGLLTDVSQTTLFILTADCLPIFFIAPDPLMVGIVHAGWRGSAVSVAQEAVKRLSDISRQSPSQFLVAFGPCIRSCCYEVGGELKNFFMDTLLERKKKLYLDLVKENRNQLERAGVQEEHISDGSSCTFCESDSFYSYRREGEKAGRMVSWIRIKNMLP